ncbi:hypothetical protein EEZ25_27385 [Micromonospora aurantiaca]|uniref:CARDB domain-containing protein n=1 Tax=Micromonospora aurantiaca (nom. illeg.) TaxID=47850 RepID=UPI000F41AFB8|nr:CARDB domain-containing protein [Micromonospora aurantiaca]RNH98166.1 hypothetical protein EEZ25_27385 [Micromonospora aurantiaca]
MLHIHLRRLGAATALALTATGLWAGTMTSPASAGPGDPPPAALPSKATDVAAAPICKNCAGDVVVVRTQDNRLFWNEVDVNNGNDVHASRFGWQEIPGAGRSPYAPAITTRADGGVSVAVTGTDGRVYTQYMDDDYKWQPNWLEVPGGGRLSEAPAIANGVADSVTVVGVGLDHRLYYHQYRHGWDPRGWRSMPGDFTTSKAPAVDVVGSFSPRLVVAARGDDTQIYTAESFEMMASGTWGSTTGASASLNTQMKKLPGPLMVTFHAPGLNLGVAGGAVYARDLTGDIVFQTLLPNGTWNAKWQDVPGNGKTNRAPASSLSQVYVVGASGNSLYVEQFSGGAQIPNQPNHWNLVPGSVVTPSGGTPGGGNPGGGGGTVPPGKPDLTWIGTPTWDAEKETLTYTFKNQGTAKAGPFRVNVYVAPPNSSYIPAGPDLVYDSVEAGGQRTVVFDVGATLQHGVNYRIAFNLDTGSTVTESNEQNNEYHNYFVY